MKKGFFRDIFRGTYLGVISCAWLGYLIALRILNWNPSLWSDFSNVAGALFFTTFLYVILGLAVGAFITIGLRIIFILAGKKGSPGGFIRTWLIVYSGLTILVFAYLTITRARPDVHVLIFDVPLVVVYVLSLLAGYWVIGSRIKRAEIGLIKASVLTIVVFIAGGLLVSYFGTPKPQLPLLGNIDEICDAVESANSNAKVFLFAVDGAEWGIIDSLIAEGKMPVTAKLIEKGTRAEIESLPTLKSPLIWTSMATGKVPEKHGILDFGSFQFPIMKNSFINYPDGIGFYRLVYTIMPKCDMPVTSTTRKVEAIWDILSMADKTVGVVGWWATWPADSVNGMMVSDRFTYTLFNPRASANTLKQGQVYPPHLLNDIIQFVRLPQDMTQEELSRFIKGGVSGDIFPTEWDASGREEWNPLYQLKMGYTSGESFFNASLYLLDAQQPDFFTVYLEGNDMVSHYFWQYMDSSEYPDPISAEDMERFGELIPRYYSYWDSLLGEAMKHLEEGTDVIVASDHGFGPDPKPKIPFRGGEHQPFGVFLAAGPHFKQGYSAEAASVIDLTPTLLYLYDLPVGEDMDGKVMKDIFREDFSASVSPGAIASYETGRRFRSSLTPSSADELIKDQLRSLGYTK